MLPRALDVGTLDRAHLRAALDAAGVRFNDAAETLLLDPAFDRPTPERVVVVSRTVRELEFEAGAAMPAILSAAAAQGLVPCPAITGPYLRLAFADQESAPDAVLSNGSAPSASLTVAAAPFSDDDDYPTGLYLRVIDGVPWLRGYWSDDTHRWAPDDAFAFRRADAPVTG